MISLHCFVSNITISYNNVDHFLKYRNVDMFMLCGFFEESEVLKVGHCYV